MQAVQARREKRRRQRQRVVNSCKAVVAFSFSHIGLAGMVVAYSIMGGFLFQVLESPYEEDMKSAIVRFKRQQIDYVIANATRFAGRNGSLFASNLNETFLAFQLRVVKAVNDGWDGNDNFHEIKWNYAGALLYAVTVTTTIGYGHVAPKTRWGRLLTILYALVGIPLTFLYLSNIGNFLANCFRLFYKRICCDLLCCQKCERKRKRERKRLRSDRNNMVLQLQASVLAQHGINSSYEHVVTPQDTVSVSSNADDSAPAYELAAPSPGTDSASPTAITDLSPMSANVRRESFLAQLEYARETAILDSFDEDNEVFESPKLVNGTSPEIGTDDAKSSKQSWWRKATLQRARRKTKSSKKSAESDEDAKNNADERTSGTTTTTTATTTTTTTDKTTSDAVEPKSKHDAELSNKTSQNVDQNERTDEMAKRQESAEETLPSKSKGKHTVEWNGTTGLIDDDLTQSKSARKGGLSRKETKRLRRVMLEESLEREVTFREDAYAGMTPDDEHEGVIMRQPTAHGDMDLTLFNETLLHRDDGLSDEDEHEERVTVPITICLVIIAGYIFAGAFLFTFWEDWDYVTGSYFCFITLSTIGFGDVVPGMGVEKWNSSAKLVLCAIWLAFGLSLLAMCFNLMQEEVKEKSKWFGHKLGLLTDEDNG